MFEKYTLTELLKDEKKNIEKTSTSVEIPKRELSECYDNTGWSSRFN